jgi:osmotically-inducible protein OsmY
MREGRRADMGDADEKEQARTYRETGGEDAGGRHGDDDDVRGKARSRERADSEIQTELEARFAEDAEVDARDVRITVSRGEVILQGSVGTRREMRIAGDLAKACCGVRSVWNEIGVRAGERPSHQRSTPGGAAAA